MKTFEKFQKSSTVYEIDELWLSALWEDYGF